MLTESPCSTYSLQAMHNKKGEATSIVQSLQEESFTALANARTKLC